MTKADNIPIQSPLKIQPEILKNKLLESALPQLQRNIFDKEHNLFLSTTIDRMVIWNYSDFLLAGKYFSKGGHWDRGSTVVKVLCYKSEGRCHNPSGATMALGLTQPLTEMSTRSISTG